ncbi:alanine racemase [Candidatus Uhrbacteria bacterium]|jgi:alanine racemase|nr:alanine racemase [Candidatus Uhrbacteria bacterium]
MHPAKSWIQIDARAYAQNLRTIESRLKPGVTLCAIVKANAYGHDIATMVRLAKASGVDHFGVDSIDEAIIVRNTAPDATIFVLGYTVAERMPDIITHNLIQTIYDEQTVKNLADAALAQQSTAQLNIKIETGTQRQGVGDRNLKSLLAEIERQTSAVNLVSVSSHFSSSEDLSKEQVVEDQNAIFSKALEEIQRFGFTPKYKHISCSASTLLYPSAHHNLVRIGIAQYGLWPSVELRRELLSSTELTPVLSWKARIAQVKDIKSGTPVGYGQSFVSDRPLRIAVIPVGYYDGYPRSLKNKAYMLVKGQKCNVIGNICMNMCMIDVSAVADVKRDDIATLVGRDGLNQITLDDLATFTSTINYESVTTIKSHLPRIVVN